MTKNDIKPGDVFGQWTVLDLVMVPAKNGRNCTQCKCVCTCGTIAVIPKSNLARGYSTKCIKCRNKATSKALKNKPKRNSRCDGRSTHRLYSTWRAMMSRCYYQAHPAYKNYGGRGIDVCDEWKSNFYSFENWAINSGYHEGVQLDRIDNDKGYCPENCRWVTPLQNSNNKSNNTFLEAFGQKHTLAEWGRMYGIHGSTISHRIKRGWSAERSICTPVASKKD